MYQFLNGENASNYISKFPTITIWWKNTKYDFHEQKNMNSLTKKVNKKKPKKGKRKVTRQFSEDDQNHLLLAPKSPTHKNNQILNFQITLCALLMVNFPKVLPLLICQNRSSTRELWTK